MTQKSMAQKPKARARVRPASAGLFSLAHQTAVITGACGFLGQTFTRALLEAGARVILMSRSDAIRRQHTAYAKEFDPSLVGSCQVDFYDHAALDAALRSVTEREQVDLLVNNAYDMGPRTGFNVPAGSLEDASFEEWAAASESGLYWAIRATQIIGAQMKQRGRGNIINISSMYGFVSPHPALYDGTSYLNPVTYSTMKAGVLAFTRYVAAYWGRHGIRCNALAPGPFPKSGPPAPDATGPANEFLDRVAQRTLLGRVGENRELVGPLLFLASEASSFMTGQALIVDGGWIAT